MTVLCANCHTANRDRAMFCIGCAGKLPAFAATGPSALDTMGAPLGSTTASPSSAERADAASARPGTTAGVAPRGLMLAVLLLGAAVLMLAAWIGFGPERAAAPGLASAAAPLQALPAAPVAAPPAVAVAAPPVQVPLDSALSPGESMVPTMPRPASAPITAPVTASAPPAAKAAPAPASSRTATTTVARANAGDPRVGCEHLFFVLAARCEAEHCSQAAYARHPRCDVVREQRRRDEARRNLTSGY